MGRYRRLSPTGADGAEGRGTRRRNHSRDARGIGVGDRRRRRQDGRSDATRNRAVRTRTRALPMTDEEIRDVFAELHRVGADLGRPPGLALGTGFRDGEFLTWLRSLPEELGHDAFVARLNEKVSALQPNAAVALPASIDGRPYRMWPTVEQMNAGIEILVREW